MRALRTAFLLVIVVVMMMLMMVMVFPVLHESVSFRLILMADQEIQGALGQGGCLLARRCWNGRRNRRLYRKRDAMQHVTSYARKDEACKQTK
jgi:hypothetical protein